MTTFFLDPEGGNDAADGTTFANRWKTLGSGATFARLSPGGHTVRIMASADPTSPGSATWTDNSRTVTWAAQKNLVIEACNATWTASANITAATDTGLLKEGTACLRLTPAAGFTTGKVAYKTLTTLDLSAYQGVSFWCRYGASATTAAGALELRLCSDTTGDTAVHTIALPAGVAGAWRTVVWDNGAALSSAIQSVALYATVDPSTTAIYLDNIVACKAGTDQVTHEHVIGKNTGGEPEWYAIMALTDAGVELGAAFGADLGTYIPRPYRGTTESVATYVLAGTKANWSAADCLLGVGGAVDYGPIVLSGGWNRTDMSTQSGVTYLNGRHYAPYAIDCGVGYTWINLEKLGALYCTSAGVRGRGGQYAWQLEQLVGCTQPVDLTAAYNTVDLVTGAIHGCTNTVTAFPAASTSANSGVYRWRCPRLHGHAAGGNAALQLMPAVEYVLASLDNNQGGALHMSNAPGEVSRVVGLQIANTGTPKINLVEGILVFDDCPYTGAPTFTSDHPAARFHATRRGGDANTHETRTNLWTLAADLYTRHTASGLSWKLSQAFTNANSSLSPAAFPLGQFLVTADTATTISVWVYRASSTTLSAGLRIRANALPGVGNTDLQALAVGAADTWEQVSVTFTPTVTGVVEALGVAWGPNAIAYFDDVDVVGA